jgi:tetratricopeptide (TPR) repeat protein
MNHTESDKYIQEGKNFKAQKRLNEAFECFERAITLKPNFSGYYELASVLSELQRWEEAIVAYQKSIKLKPNFWRAQLDLAKLLQQIDRQEEALFYVRQVIECEPKQPFWVYKLLGDISTELEELDAAIVAYETAVSLNPEQTILFATLGKLNYQISNPEIAKNYLEKAIKLNPDRPAWVYRYLGDTLSKLDLKEEAIAAYKYAIQLKPNLPIIVYVNLAITLLQQQKIEDVLAVETAILKRESQEVERSSSLIARLQVQIGNFFLQQKDLSLAVQYYLQAINSHTEIKEAYAKLRLIQVSMKFQTSYLDETISAYKLAIQNNPSLPKQAYVNLGDLLTQQDNFDEAIQYYQYVSKQNLLDRYPNCDVNSLDLTKILGPKFMIIGSMKGGTTSLYNYIIKHPQVIAAVKKEIHFFDEYYRAGIDWYLAHFPPQIEEKKYISGEASPGYSLIDNPEIILKEFPDVKLIVILRNPVERTISHYFHNVKLGLESRSFETVMYSIVDILNRLNDSSNYDEIDWIMQQNCYLKNSLYAYHLKKWFALVPQEQLLILKSEDLFISTNEIMQQVFDFIELPFNCQINYKTYNSGSYGTKVKSDIRNSLSLAFQPYTQKLVEDLGVDITWNN